MKHVVRHLALIAVCSTPAVTAAQTINLITTPPTHVRSGEPFGMRLMVKVSGTTGPVSAAIVSLDVEEPSGAAPARIVGARSATTDSAGQASFTGLGLTGVAGVYTLTFRTETAVSAPLEVVLEPGSPTSLRVSERDVMGRCPGDRESEDPALTPSRTQFCIPFKVVLTDTAGNEVERSGVPIKSELASGGGTLSGTTTVETNREGVAVFSHLSVAGQRGDRTLRFTADGLKSDVSDPCVRHVRKVRQPSHHRRDQDGFRHQAQ